MSTTALQSTEPLVDRLRAFRTASYERKTLPGESGKPIDCWPAGVTAPAGEALRDVVIREGCKRTVETGLGLGLSSLWIAEGLLAKNPEQSIEHVTIDPHQAWCDHAGVRTIRESGMAAFTRVLLEESCVSLGRMLQQGERFDLAFIDGGHHFDHKFIDAFFALRLVRPGGLVVLDDHWLPATQMILAFFTTNLGIQLEMPDPEHPGARFAYMRVPKRWPQREWDHFVPFSRETLPEFPWRR
jgi:predicted O-methyltransferase YrrM